MIPKTIHYCWFGCNPKPKLAEKCIISWKKHCPDYQLIEWNEDNFDILSAPLYVRQAYEAKKWAFVTDYVRLQVVYNMGGVYLDTDVEAIKCFDALLENTAFFGFESNKYVNTGLGFGAEKGSSILKELMDDYSSISFIKNDGTFDLKPCPVRNTLVFVKHGLKQNGNEQVLDNGIHIYPVSFFCPYDIASGMLKKRKETYSIHWFQASWYDTERRIEFTKQRERNRIDHLLHIPNRFLLRLIGNEKYEKLKAFLIKHR